MKKFKELLVEASLGRIYQHLKSGRQFAIMNAFRSERPKEENVDLNNALAMDVKNKGYGYFFLEGHWIENKKKPTRKWVEEDALFIIAPAKDNGFKKNIENWLKEYDQESAVIKDQSGVVYLMDDNGKKETNFDKFHPNQVADIYSRMKRKNRDATFVLESLRRGKNFFDKLKELHK